jgi:hypothetical protein
MNKSERWLLEYLNQQLKDTERMLLKHIRSAKPIPNPLYMIEENQHETIWSDKDNDTYYKIEFRRRWLEEQIEELKNN